MRHLHGTWRRRAELLSERGYFLDGRVNVSSGSDVMHAIAIRPDAQPIQPVLPSFRVFAYGAEQLSLGIEERAAALIPIATIVVVATRTTLGGYMLVNVLPGDW